MKLKLFLSLVLFLFSVNFVFAQFIVKETYMETTGLSNEGLVAGYVSQGGTYSIWNPDLGSTTDIGGLAPGQGVGGQAHFSDEGLYLCGTSMGLNGAEMSRYQMATNEWVLVGSLGFSIDNTVSGGFAISGNGSTVAGNSWADTTGGLAYTHAVAWVEGDGLFDLGTLHAGRSTRVNAVNYDGSVLVGWQDFNGPWKSAVWRKNPNGGYFPNQYLLIDPSGDPSDEYNQLGECSAVSANGNWIGGYGDYANNNEPWIWSEATGVINLGTLAEGAQGFVSGISVDGSIVVGWFNVSFWDPQLPFIWTSAGGLQNLNTYINDVLGYSTGTYQIYSANCMSSNGQYIGGYGIDNATFNYFAYRVGLVSTGIQEVAETGNLTVFPNPTSGFLTIENHNKAILTIYCMDGRILDITEINGNHVLDISAYKQGLYFLSVQSGNLTQTAKFVKN